MQPRTRFLSRVVGLWTRAASAAWRADAAPTSTPGTPVRPSATTVTVTGKVHEPAPADSSGQMTRRLRVVVACAATLVASGNVSATPVAIQSARVWKDTEGAVIQAHGCGMLEVSNRFYQSRNQLIRPCRVGRLSFGAALMAAMLFMKAMLTWSPSKRQVTVSWCGVS